jgi:hypothetical protein
MDGGQQQPGTEEDNAAAAATLVAEYSMTVAWPQVDASQLGQPTKPQLWTALQQQAGEESEDYADAREEERRNPKRRLEKERLEWLVHEAVRKRHERSFRIVPITLQPGIGAACRPERVAVEPAARINARRSGDRSDNNQLLESVARGTPWRGLSVLLPTGGAARCRAYASVYLSTWAALVGWRGSWARVPAHTHRPVIGYRWRPADDDDDDGDDAQAGGSWPTAPVEDEEEGGTSSGTGITWDAVLDANCLDLKWLRVPLPLLYSVEEPLPAVGAEGGLRELVLDYCRRGAEGA